MKKQNSTKPLSLQKGTIKNLNQIKINGGSSVFCTGLIIGLATGHIASELSYCEGSMCCPPPPKR